MKEVEAAACFLERRTPREVSRLRGTQNWEAGSKAGSETACLAPRRYRQGSKLAGHMS